MNAKNSHKVSDDSVWLRLVRRSLDLICGAAMALSATGILVALALIGWSVVMRYVFNQPPVWVDEVVGFLLVGIVTLAAADVLRRGEHIGVDVLTTLLGSRQQRWAHAWSAIAAFGTAVIFIVNGWETAMFSRMLGIVTEGHLELSAWWLILFLPLCGVMMALAALEALLRLATGAEPIARAHHGPGDEP